jgi:hypothetical protein
MAALDKLRLRRALRALQEIPVEVEEDALYETKVQESLDFLAMLAGIKPVYVAGRGFDEPAWIEGVRALAAANRLYVVRAGAWLPEEPFAGLPEWYLYRIGGVIRSLPITYVCKARATQAAVVAACETGAPTVGEEARLLGFPVCCVAAQHQRFRIYHEYFLAILERRGGGDVAKMQELLATADDIDPETDVDRDALARATAVVPAPFTSLNLCDACAASPASPGMRLTERYGNLAAAIDPDYFWVLST